MPSLLKPFAASSLDSLLETINKYAEKNKYKIIKLTSYTPDNTYPQTIKFGYIVLFDCDTKLTAAMLCPKCLGEGLAPDNLGVSTSTAPMRTCPTCQGVKLVPKYIKPI